MPDPELFTRTPEQQAAFEAAVPAQYDGPLSATQEGIITVIEGIDASGKMTQSDLLVARIQEAGEKAVKISFPVYESHTGKLIKRLLKQELVLAGRSEMYPAAYDRADALEQARLLQVLMTINRYEIAGAMQSLVASGTHLVLDRYYPSGEVYGYIDGLENAWLRNIHSQLPAPDLGILMDISVEESFKRRPTREDLYESNREFLGKVRQGYLDWFKDHAEDENLAGHIHILDGSGTVDELHETIWSAWKVLRG